jgi:APA family basic amino acid/polyamine antiporter
MNQKVISLYGGVSILVGIMIGSGIFFLGGQILSRAANSLPLSLLAWLIGGIITLFSGLTYAELGSLFPVNGGYYVYLKEAYGKRVAFLSGFMNLILSSSGSIALLAILFSQVLSAIFPALESLISLVSILAIIILTAVNYVGIKVGTLVQIIFTVAKLVPIAIIIVMGLIIGRQPFVFTSGLADLTFIDTIIAVAFAVVGTLWAYEGWTNLNAVAGQMKDARKDLSKALSIAIYGVIVIYLLFILSMYRLVSYQALLEAYNGWFVFNAAYALFGDAGQLLLMISVAISVFGALNGTILVFPRVYQKMAEDQLFFSIFKNESKAFKTPVYTLLLSAVMSIVLILAGFDINALLTFVVFAGLIFNTLIFISVFLFRKRMPVSEYPRYQVIGYPIIPFIAIFGMVLLLIATIIESTIPSLIGVMVLALGYGLITFIENKKTRT